MPETATREDLLSDWLVEFRSKGTRGTYRRAVLQFSDWLDGELLEATRNDIRRWVAHLISEELADSSIRAKVSAVSSFYKHLHSEGLVDPNPAVDIRRPQGESEPRLGLTADQAHRLIDGAENHSAHAAALVWLMAGAGLRVEEACSSRIEDLNGDLLTVKVKGGHRQTKALSLEVLGAVARVVDGYLDIDPQGNPVGIVATEGRTREEGPIVVDGEGRPVKVWRAQDLIAELGARAGIPERVHPHILRHTAATLALEAGTPVEDVSALLGHRSIETTLRYVRNRDVIGGTRAAAARLGKTLRASRGGFGVITPVLLLESLAFGTETFAPGAGSPVLSLDVVSGVAVGVVVIHALLDRMPRRDFCHWFTPFLPWNDPTRMGLGQVDFVGPFEDRPCEDGLGPDGQSDYAGVVPHDSNVERFGLGHLVADRLPGAVGIGLVARELVVDPVDVQLQIHARTLTNTDRAEEAPA